MTVQLKKLGILCLAALAMYGCKDDSASSSDNGAEATGARQNRDTVNEAALERVLAVMRMDEAVMDSITCEAPCSGMLSDEQEAVVAKLKHEVRGELRRGQEVEVAPGVMRYQELSDVEVLVDAVQRANVKTKADVEAWLGGLDAEQLQFVNRTFMLLMNAWARASDLPEPFQMPRAVQTRPLTVVQTGQFESQSYPLTAECITIVIGGSTYIISGGTAATLGTAAVGTAALYDTNNDVDITSFECTNWDWKGFVSICCGYICYPKRGEWDENDMCTPGAKKASTRWDELDPDDCDEIVYPDMGPPEMGPPEMGPPEMGPPDMDTPDMKKPDMGVEEQDAGEVPGNEQPSERQ